LENIFTEERMETINIICTQAGISIHNAMMFSSLENQVAEKTKAYAELNANLEQRVQKQVSEIETLNRIPRFVSPPVARLLMSEGGKEKLKKHRKEIGVLFCDIRGFAAYSDPLEPEESIEMLDEYHAIVGKTVNKYGAVIDHRAGDGYMIFLNDPFDIEDPINAMLEMAIELRTKVSRLTAIEREKGREIGFGIGLSYGYCTIGLIDNDDRLDYSATGGYVVLASRLCDIALDGQILFPVVVASGANEKFAPEFDKELKVKGVSSNIQVYRI